jgi:TolB-like protein
VPPVSLFEELKRRNVIRVAIAYAITAWLLLQLVDLVLENVNAPDWVMQVFMLALAIGFPLAIFFAWAFELTPEGVKRESEVDRSQSTTSQTGQKLNSLIIGILVVALAWFAWDKFASVPVTAKPVETDQSRVVEAAREQTPNNKTIAVLPFVAMSNGADDEYFADGLTEEILNSLAQLPELLITARTSSFHFKGQDVPVQEIAEKLGVGHIVEGSVRRSGNRLRVTAQLVRSSDGFHVWSENYDSTSDDTIQVQEDIAEKIAVAMNVIMDTEKRKAMRRAGLRDVEAFVNYQKARALFEQAHGDVIGDAGLIEYLRRANKLLETVMEKAPAYPPAYIDHMDLYVHMLLESTTGSLPDGVTETDLAEAQDKILADLTLALEHARNSMERSNIELDQAFLSGTWRGMRQKLERTLVESGCSEAAWVESIAVMYGVSDRYALRARDIRECDPMQSRPWFDESRAFLWAGDPSEALKIAREGVEIAPGNSLSQALINALVALGQYEEMDSAITNHLQLKENELRSRVLKSAAMGDYELTARLYNELINDPVRNTYWISAYYAWAGERENANRRAAQIDSQAFGSQFLLQVVLLCTCGAPWEIEATPNLAARIKEAGMLWPPASPIHFPLKDW